MQLCKTCQYSVYMKCACFYVDVPCGLPGRLSGHSRLSLTESHLGYRPTTKTRLLRHCQFPFSAEQRLLNSLFFATPDGHARKTVIAGPHCADAVMWKKWSTPKSFAGDSQDNHLGTPLSQQSRSLGLPPTPTGRQASQHLPRQEQDGGAVFQLCDRISGFAYGESEQNTEDDYPLPSKALESLVAVSY